MLGGTSKYKQIRVGKIDLKTQERDFDGDKFKKQLS